MYDSAAKKGMTPGDQGEKTEYEDKLALLNNPNYSA